VKKACVIFFVRMRSDPCLNPDLEDLGEILRIMMRGDGVGKEGVEGITSAIIGAGMRVHSVLGSGFQEVIYQRALEIEFLKVGLSYAREKSMEIRYEGHKIGSRRVDFYVGEAVMVELKAVDKLEGIHLVQAKNYLEAYGEQHGLLLNFGGSSLEFKRLYGRRRKLALNCSHNPENGIKNPQNSGSDK
jgi:GxxExxY protein